MPLTFDWDRGVMVSRFRGESNDVALPPDTQDRLSFMYQFMNLAPGAGPMVVTMSNGRKVERYAYRLVDEVRLSTPAGDFETRKPALTELAEEVMDEISRSIPVTPVTLAARIFAERKTAVTDAEMIAAMDGYRERWRERPWLLREKNGTDMWRRAVPVLPDR